MADGADWTLLHYTRTPRGSLLRFHAPLLRFMQTVYECTGGGYPRLEWITMPIKPTEPRFTRWFAKHYGGFLRWRLRVELDELWLAVAATQSTAARARSRTPATGATAVAETAAASPAPPETPAHEHILGVVGANYDFSRAGKKRLGGTFHRLLRTAGVEERPERMGFVELLAVLPQHTRRGIGAALLDAVLAALRGLGKTPYAVTFPGLDAALRLYEKYDAEFYEVRGFKWSPADKRGLDYIVVRFPTAQY